MYDLNNDTVSDVVIVDESNEFGSHDVRSRPEPGNTWDKHLYFDPESSNEPRNFRAFKVRDVNYDGIAEFVIVESVGARWNYGLYMATNNGGGGGMSTVYSSMLRVLIFTHTGGDPAYAVDMIYVQGTPRRNVALAFFDAGNDADLDIALALINEETNSIDITFIENRGPELPLHFRSPVLLASLPANAAGDVETIMTVDADDDGEIDTLVVIATRSDDADPESDIFTIRIGTQEFF